MIYVYFINKYQPKKKCIKQIAYNWWLTEMSSLSNKTIINKVSIHNFS